MSKTYSYILAALACAAYWILFLVILVYIGGRFDRLGMLWKTLFFWMPIVGIWKGITSFGKNKKETEGTKDETKTNN